MKTFGIQSSMLFLAVSSVFMLVSCKKGEDVAPLTGEASRGEINDWILDNMQTYYYWNDKLPANPDTAQAPGDFFNSILYHYDATTNPNGDRFSWIQESAEVLVAGLSGESKTTGMEFSYYRKPQNTTEVVASVLYVLPGSPAAKAGFKRGDLIAKVNGTTMTDGTTGTYFSSLLFGEGDTKTYGLAGIEYDKNDPTKISAIVDMNESRTVTAAVFQEDPVYLDSVYTVGAKKIGYLVYNQFVPGPNGSTTATYDQKIDAIFGKFKAQGVNELILDFRYNPGGYVSSATLLGSLIAKNVGTKSVFTRKEWNPTITPELQKKYGADYFYDYLQQKANNIGSNLQQVYVLTTTGTASASELVINGLRPYMNQQVYTIGQKTYGKNVGSITISDKTKRIKWGIQPIVSKSFNKDNQSDYSVGFKPKVELTEGINKKQLGDVTERYLSEAIFQITGTRMARRAAPDEQALPSIGSSVTRKAGGSNMFFNDEVPGIHR
jgi:C-terminal processing protease CtpA/Prc